MVWCALSLFQVGEFSFILLSNGLNTGTLSADTIDTMTSAIVLSMLLTPFVIRAIPGMVKHLESRSLWFKTLSQVIPPSPVSVTEGHSVVIAGYGPIAQNLSAVLQRHEIGFRVIEMNMATVQTLQQAGIHSIFGDASSLEVLRHAGIAEARVFAVTIPDIRSAELAIQHARQLNPDLYCIVRSRYQYPIADLFAMGANEIVYEEFETSMSFVYSVLDYMGDPVSDRESYLLLLRENRQTLLQGNLGGKQNDQPRYGRFSVFKETKVEWITLPEGSLLAGKTLAEAALRAKTGVTILSVIDPSGIEHTNPDPDLKLVPQQVLVVIGTLEQLTRLEVLLLPQHAQPALD
jgi:CPA2 family monovalent cation:H+ antiporter-2